MIHFLLLDVAPDPVSAGIGIVGLFLIGVVVLMVTAAVILGLVFLLRSLLRAKRQPNAISANAPAPVQPSSPNQP